MSDELLAYLQGVKDSRVHQAVLNFASTAINKLEAALAAGPLEKGVRTWDDWHNARSDFPLLMNSCSEIILFGKFCKKPVKAPIWKKFMDYMDDHPNRGALGLIAKATGNGLYVIHNKWDLPQTTGALRIRVAATTEGLGVCLEPLPSFAAAVRLIWHP